MRRAMKLATAGFVTGLVIGLLGLTQSVISPASDEPVVLAQSALHRAVVQINQHKDLTEAGETQLYKTVMPVTLLSLQEIMFNERSSQ